MTLYPAYPSVLAEAEFAMVRFSLDLLAPCTLELGTLLGLRQPLYAAGKALAAQRRSALFEPPLSSDPVALRRYQKPAPPFVIRPAAEAVGAYQEGDRLELEVLFLGTGTLTIGDMLTVLQALGERGLTHGEGLFEVVAVHSQGADGSWRLLWRESQANGELVPALAPLDQWLDRVWPTAQPVVLVLDTPARLIAAGRVLRRPQFSQLFPFLLRRVSSMLHAHCGIEPVSEPARLREEAALVESVWLDCQWLDWRAGRSGDDAESLGGCTGRLRLTGLGLDNLLWVILLATLFGIGKGAAYGAGHCRLTAAT